MITMLIITSTIFIYSLREYKYSTCIIHCNVYIAVIICLKTLTGDTPHDIMNISNRKVGAI